MVFRNASFMPRLRENSTCKQIALTNKVNELPVTKNHAT